MEFDAEFKFAKIQNSYVRGRWGGSQNLMLSSNLLKSKIPMLRWGSRKLMLSSNLLKSKIPMSVGRGGGGRGLTEIDAQLKFSKIQNSYVEGGGLLEFDADFKFAKIQNSYVEGVSRKLMLSSNLLKSKIPMSGWGRGEVGGTNFQLLMLSPNLLKKKFFWRKISKFSGKKHNGFVLDFEYQVVPLYKI